MAFQTIRTGRQSGDQDFIEITRDFDYGGYAMRAHVTSSPGSGDETVVFLIGAFQDPRSMKHVVRHFAATSVAIVIEMPGSLGDEVLPKSYDFNWLADSLAYVFSELELESVNILAASYATPLAVSFASKYPELVNKVALAGAASGLSEATIRSMEWGVYLCRTDLDQFSTFCASSLLMNPDPTISIKHRKGVWRVITSQLKNLDPVQVRRVEENTSRVIEAARAQTTPVPQCPVLGFAGQHDQLTSPVFCRTLMASFPNAVFTTINDTDHLFYLEDPSTVHELME